MIKEWVNDPAHADYFKTRDDIVGEKGSLVLAPSDARVKEAARLLSSVPTTSLPIDTAKYMIKNLPPGYKMEWPKDTPTAKMPANPLIVAFFSATRTDPVDGDQTAWCAAFMCWTLRRCGKPYPNNAGSKSFRDFKALPSTDDPQPGNLVVFKNASHPDNGHVAFFDGFTDATKSKVWCVGGNQHDELSRRPFPVSGNLHVVSYRTVPS